MAKQPACKEAVITAHLPDCEGDAYLEEGHEAGLDGLALVDHGFTAHVQAANLCGVHPVLLQQVLHHRQTAAARQTLGAVRTKDNEETGGTRRGTEETSLSKLTTVQDKFYCSLPLKLGAFWWLKHSREKRQSKEEAGAAAPHKGEVLWAVNGWFKTIFISKVASLWGADRRAMARWAPHGDNVFLVAAESHGVLAQPNGVLAHTHPIKLFQLSLNIEDIERSGYNMLGASQEGAARISSSSSSLRSVILNL